MLERLTDVTEGAVDQLSGGPAADLLDKARDLDQALGDLRAATQPLTHPITPLRARRNTAQYVVALLETCAYHARSLAATAELLPTHPSIAADPRLRGAVRRTVRNIEAIAARVADEEAVAEVETGPSIASLLQFEAGGCRGTGASPGAYCGTWSVWTRRWSVSPGRSACPWRRRGGEGQKSLGRPLASAMPRSSSFCLWRSLR